MEYKNFKTYSSGSGNDKILSNVFSSINFDGEIYKEKLKVNVSTLKAGDILYLENPEYLEDAVSFTISKIDLIESLYYVYYPGEFSFEDQLTINSPNEDGSYLGTEEFYVLRENPSRVNAGTSGWGLTTGGMAIFTDIIARGEIQATSGEIEGILTVGRNINNDPLMRLGSNIFSDETFDGISAKQNGLLIDGNNYLLSYESSTLFTPTSVVVSSSNVTTIRRLVSVTVPNHTFALIDSTDRTESITFSGISGTGNINSLNDKSFIIETIVGGVISFYAYLDITVRTSQSLSGTVIKSGPFDTMTMTTVTVADSPVVDARKTVNFNFSNHNIPDNELIIFSGFSSTLESLNDTSTVIVKENAVTAVTPSSPTTGSATYTATGHTFAVGNKVTISGCSVSGYNGTFTITAVATNTFRVANATTATGSTWTNGFAYRSDQLSISSFLIDIADGTYTSGLGNISYLNNNAKFKVGNESNFMSYSSESDILTVTGTVNATGGNFTNTVTVGSNATKISIAGTSSTTTTAIWSGTTSFQSGGFWMDASGRFSLGNIATAGLSWNPTGSVLTVKGTIKADSGTIGGFDIFSDRLVDTGAKQVEIIPDNLNVITVYQNQYQGVEINKTGVVISKQLLSYENVVNDDSVVIGQTITGEINVNYDFTTIIPPSELPELSAGDFISTLIRPEGWTSENGRIEDFQVSSISVTALNTYTVNTVQNHGFTAGQPIYFHNPRLNESPDLYIATYASSSTTRTIGTGSPHNLLPGDTIVISNGKYFFDIDSEAFDGTFIVRSTPTTTSFTYLATTALTLATQSLIKTITNRQTSGSIATITTSIAHGLIAGDYVYIYDLAENYNGYHEITNTPSATQISYETGGDDEALTVDAGSLIITDTSDWSNSISIKTQNISGFLKVLGTPTSTSFTISKSSNTAISSVAMTYPGNEVGINTFFTTILLDQIEKTMEITSLDSSSISINLGDYSAYTSTPVASSVMNLVAGSVSSSNVTKEITSVSLSKAASNNNYPGLIMNYNGSFGGSLSTWAGAISLDNAAAGDAGYIYLGLPRREGANYSYYGDLTLNSEEIFLFSSKASVSNLDYQIESNINISPDLGVSINNISVDTRYYLSNLATSETRVPGYSLQIEASTQDIGGNETANKVMRFSPNQIQVTDVFNEVASTLSIQPYGGTTAFGGAITLKGNINSNTNPIGTIYANNWFRAKGQSGFFLEDYSVGWNTDTLNVMKLYSGNQLEVPGNLLVNTIELIENTPTEAAYYGSAYMYDGNAASSGRKILYLSSTGTSPDYRMTVAPSGLKFKDNILEFVETDEKLEAYLNINPVTFNYKSAITAAEESGKSLEDVELELGFIANDFQDAGLDMLYQTDSDGDADYLAYDRLPVYNFIIIKKQQERIKQLESSLILLENRLAALES